MTEKFLSQRESEINDHMLELIYLEYAEAFYKNGDTAQAIKSLKKAVKKYNGDWEKRLLERIEYYSR